jgi:hypothetical protein
MGGALVMRVTMFAITIAFAMSLVGSAGAATKHAELTWEQCHIQSLRQGFNPYHQAYVNHMMHCLAGKPGK